MRAKSREDMLDVQGVLAEDNTVSYERKFTLLSCVHVTNFLQGLRTNFN